MVYKYQEETIEEIDKAMDKLEEMTEEFYRIFLGWRHTFEFENENIPLFVTINGENRFEQQTTMDNCYDTYSRCPILNYNRIEIQNNIFLEINKTIDKIFKDNRKRKEFHEKLNHELQALNKTL